MPLMCSAPDCERRAARRHPDHPEQWVCTWHPEREAPPRKGDLYVAPDTKKPAKMLPRAPMPTLPPPKSHQLDEDLVELQDELDDLKHSDPTVTAAATSYAQTVDSILARPAPELPPRVPIGGGTRCLLERGDNHPDQQVQQAARIARNAIEVLISALLHADLKTKAASR